MARVSYATPSQATGDAHEVMAKIREQGGEVLNLHRALARSPSSLRNFLRLGNSLLSYGQLPPVLREIVILRIAQTTGADYEWAHHVPLAKQAGVTNEQIARLRVWTAADVFDARVRAALRYADAAVGDRLVPDDVFEAARSQLSEGEIVELTLVCGFWGGLVACVLRSLEIDIEPAFRRHLPRERADAKEPT
ncbi:MAG: carboxymuconolactone decarboxylase family protein, partial [Dehalococcoidia bacterium]